MGKLNQRHVIMALFGIAASTMDASVAWSVRSNADQAALRLNEGTQSVSSQVAANSSQGRSWTVADSIGVRYYGASNGGWQGNARGPAIVPSPDGKYFYAVSTNGNLECDCVIRK